ncbi:ribonuclease H-like domain-containing protein [Tanacetum coccineum]
MTETMKQYMIKTCGNYGSGVVRPKINDKTHFELKGQYLKELRENTFSGSEHEDANKHIKKILEIVDLFHIPGVTQDQYCPPARTAKKMEEINNFQQEPDESLFRAWGRRKELLMKCPQHYLTDMQEKWHNGTSSKAISTETSDGLAAIQAQLNNLEREFKKVNKKVYTAQFGAPYQPAGHYKVAGPGFYQRNNENSSYPDRRQTLEESLTKFMAKSAKRHEENSNIIKEIRASTDAAIRNQGASIKTLEIQIGQMSKVLQERGIGEAQDVKILEAYDHTLPQEEKDIGSFTLPCFIHNVCFDKALVDLGASVSVMPFSTYTNLGLGILSHTRLTIELADRTITQPRGIAKNVPVRIGKFIFPIDFIILDIPEDDDVPLILGRPFLSTAYSKIDVYKRKITLRLIGEDNELFDPLNGNYIELNDLDTPLEPDTNQDVNCEPTFVNEPDNVKTSSECCYKMKFSCTNGYKNVDADFIPSLSVNLITKSFYYSIIKDKDGHKGKSPAEALIDIPVFVGKFSILTGFIIVDNEDVTRDVALGKPFFMKYLSCQMIMKKFAHGDKCERMMDK